MRVAGLIVAVGARSPRLQSQLGKTPRTGNLTSFSVDFCAIQAMGSKVDVWFAPGVSVGRDPNPCGVLELRVLHIPMGGTWQEKSCNLPCMGLFIPFSWLLLFHCD